MDSGFQSLGSRIPPSKFPRFQIKQAKKFGGFPIRIHLHGTSLGLQANPFTVSLFRLKDRGRFLESIAESSALQDG